MSRPPTIAPSMPFTCRAFSVIIRGAFGGPGGLRKLHSGALVTVLAEQADEALLTPRLAPGVANKPIILISRETASSRNVPACEPLQ